ncbi:low-density lipoprotein receptor-related protein 1-like [Varroa jacobsoni]|uniref:low-density lipoprotein receptor-related protein 1-like n=1 Tax=Varroa jacobsoni TaxID=62625 RepID=UPI000BF46190|nr:low-density lipoprotein receptor-related protein 1-like [Varroa jacobsoni]
MVSQYFPFTASVCVFVALTMGTLIISSEARSPMRFRTATDVREESCESLLGYKGKCRSYHVYILKTCQCFSDHKPVQVKQIPERCRDFVCKETKPTCISDPDKPYSVCTTCEQYVTGVNQSCIKAGVCYEISDNLFCCQTGYQAEKNECVDIDECAVHKDTCDQICENHPGTYSCRCKEGFQEVDERCIPQDGCVKLNCSHMCIQTEKGAKCDCQRGYKLVNSTQCVLQERVCPTGYHLDVVENACMVLGVDPQLIFVDDRTNKVYGVLIHKNDSIDDLGLVGMSANGLAYDTTKHVAYFVGDNLTAMYFDAKGIQLTTTKLNHTGRSTAYDWRALALYVLDYQTLTYWNVSYTTPLFEAELFAHDGTIRDIVIEPFNSWLFWAGRGYVMKTTLQGKQPVKVFSIYKHLQTENADSECLAIDNTEIYDPFIFYAANTHLFSFDSSGTHITFHTSDLPGPVLSMDVFEDWVYMVIKGQGGIHARRKIDPVIVTTLFRGQSARAIYINHPLRQNDNYIWSCTAECEQLCFRLSNLESVCACRKGYRLAQNRRSCNEIILREETECVTPSPNSSQEYRDVMVMPEMGDSPETYRIGENSDRPSGRFALITGFGLVLLLTICVSQMYLLWVVGLRHQFGNSFDVLARFTPQHDAISIMQLSENERL